MIDFLWLGIGAGVASVAWFLFLIWCCSHAWWLGVRAYWSRKHQQCHEICLGCSLWRSCLERIQTIDPDELQHKDEANEPWVKAWKKEVTVEQ